MSEITRLPIADQADAMLGIAAFVATVAFPESIAKRDKVVRAAKTLRLQAAEIHNPSIALRVEFRAPSFAKLAKQINQASDRLVLRRFRGCEMALQRRMGGKRLVFDVNRKTGQVVTPLRVEAATKTQLMVEMIATAKRDATALGRHVRTQTDENYVRRYIWRETLPVLHLALSLKRELEDRNLSPWKWPLLMRQGDEIETLRRMIDRAERQLEFLFAHFPDMQRCGDKAIRLTAR